MKLRAVLLKWAPIHSLAIPTLSKQKLTALFFAFALLLAQSAPAFASFVSIPYVFSNNTIADPNQVNSDFNAITGVINGGLDSTNFATNTGLTLQQITGYNLANCRLTLTSGNAAGVDAGPATGGPAATTLYLDPWQGNVIGCYNPTLAQFIGYPLINELSIAGNSTNFPTANMYYISVHWNGTALVFDAPVVWSGINAPPTTQTIQGVVCASGTGTSRIVGAVYWNGTSFNDNFYARNVCNLPQNTIPKALLAPVTSSPVTVPTAAGAVLYNGTAATFGSNQLQYCDMFANTISPLWQFSMRCVTTGAPGVTSGIGIDSTSSFSGTVGNAPTYTMLNGTASTIGVCGVINGCILETPGLHNIYKLASGTGTANSSTYLNDNLTLTVNH